MGTALHAAPWQNHFATPLSGMSYVGRSPRPRGPASDSWKLCFVREWRTSLWSVSFTSSGVTSLALSGAMMLGEGSRSSQKKLELDRWLASKLASRRCRYTGTGWQTDVQMDCMRFDKCTDRCIEWLNLSSMYVRTASVESILPAQAGVHTCYLAPVRATCVP